MGDDPVTSPMTIGLPGGFHVPIPRWTISLFGVLAVVAIAFGTYRYFYPHEPELVSVKQANYQLRLEVQEYNKHIMQAPDVTLDAPDKVKLAAYTDGCIIITVKSGLGMSTRLLVEPSRLEPAKVISFLRWPVVAAQARAKCLEPHPGKFSWRYGDKARGEPCWVPVIRTFEDGCEHIQMFNTCSNTWASDREGKPVVTWTKCVHGL